MGKKGASMAKPISKSKTPKWKRGFLVGDIHIWRDYNFTGWVARTLLKIRDMLPLKETWNHISVATGPFQDISAEVSRGVKLINITDPKKVEHSELRTYRFRNLTNRQRSKILGELKNHLGKKYATTLWVLNGLTILMFYFFLLHIIPLILFVIIALIAGLPSTVFWTGLIILGIIVLIWLGLRLLVDNLKRRDRKYEHCSENFALIFGAIKMWSPLARNANHDFPNGILQVLENLRLQGVVELIHVKPRGLIYPCPSAPLPPVLRSKPTRSFLARLLP
jgi:hypothetical protein